MSAPARNVDELQRHVQRLSLSTPPSIVKGLINEYGLFDPAVIERLINTQVQYLTNLTSSDELKCGEHGEAIKHRLGYASSVVCDIITDRQRSNANTPPITHSIIKLFRGQGTLTSMFPESKFMNNSDAAASLTALPTRVAHVVNEEYVHVVKEYVQDGAVASMLLSLIAIEWKMKIGSDPIKNEVGESIHALLGQCSSIYESIPNHPTDRIAYEKRLCVFTLAWLVFAADPENQGEDYEKLLNQLAPNPAAKTADSPGSLSEPEPAVLPEPEPKFTAIPEVPEVLQFTVNNCKDSAGSF